MSAENLSSLARWSGVVTAKAAGASSAGVPLMRSKSHRRAVSAQLAEVKERVLLGVLAAAEHVRPLVARQRLQQAFPQGAEETLDRRFVGGGIRPGWLDRDA